MKGYTFLIYGDGGTGKSYLATTAPGRKLFLDVEDRSDSLPGEVVHWNLSGQFPDGGESATIVVPCTTGEQLNKIVAGLKSGRVPVRSVVIDSVTLLQQNIADDKFGGEMSQQKWGVLLKDLKAPLRELQRLAKSPESPIECVVLTAWHREYTIGLNDAAEVRVKPFIQGQLLQHLSHLTDVVGYLKIIGSGERKKRTLQVEPTSGVTAKSTHSTLDKYNGFVPQPNITKLISEMKPNKETTNVSN